MKNKKQSSDRSEKPSFSHWSTLVGNDLWACRWQLVSAYLLSLFAAGTIVLLPWPLKLTIDYVLAGNPLPASIGAIQDFLSAVLGIESTTTNLIILFACSYALIALTAALLSTADKLISARILEKLVLRFRTRVLARLQNLPLLMRSNYSKGDLVFRISGDVYQFVRLLSKTIPTIFRHLALSLFTLGVMFWIEPWLALVGLTIVTIMAIVVVYFGAQLHKASRQKRSHEGAVAGFSQEIVKALPTIQALGLEKPTQKRFRSINEQSLAAGVKQVRVSVGMERAMQITNGIAIGLIMGACALYVVRGLLTVGDLTVFIAYMIQLLKPVEKINELALAVSRGISRGERLAALIAEIPEFNDRSDSTPIAHSNGTIEFRSVNFAYADHNPNKTLLHNISFKLARGQLVVLNGPSGSGKSTLIGLLLRQLDPSSGEILLDKRPYPELTLRSLRKQFAVMLQQHDLFAGTIRELLWTKDIPADDGRIWQVLALVDLEKYVKGLPKGLDADLAEDGLNLSGGQRARLSLARTLLLDRPILLLDEPLANIDTKSQWIILNALDQIRADKTCLVISHQPILTERADRVFTLESGKLTQSEYSNPPKLVEGLD